jgi:hypothetical protein
MASTTAPIVALDRKVAALLALISVVNTPFLMLVSARVCGLACILLSAALCFFSTRPSYMRLRDPVAVAYRLCIAALAQAMVAGRFSFVRPVSSVWTFFLGRQLPIICLLLSATLQLRGPAWRTLAAVASLVLVFAVQQGPACAALLHSYTGIDNFFVRTATGMRAAVTALSDAFGTEATVEAPAICPAYACQAAMMLFFVVCGVTGAIVGGARLGG